MKKILSIVLILFVAMAFMPLHSYGASKSLSTPDVSVTVTKDSVELSWNKISGATKYQVYRSASSNGSYKRIKTTTARKFTNSGLKAGKMYFYKVRAVGNKKYSGYCKLAATPLEKPVCKINAQVTMNKVRTNAVEGATGYAIYRSDSKDGKYYQFGTTASLYFDDTEAQAGRIYYYKMKAYKKNGSYTTYSSWSEISPGTRLLEAPELEAVMEPDPEDETINVIRTEWTEVPAAEGYELWRSSDEGYNYSKIYSGSDTSFVDRTCQDGKTYYYKARAFRTVYGVKDYGYSSPSKHSRMKLVKQAQSWLGYDEKNGKYKDIIDIYNNYKPLPRGMKGQYKEAWCTTMVTAAAIKSGTVDIMPRERICRYMIDLYKEIGCWVEEDDYVPQPGDLIMYDWEDDGRGDCTGAPNHIGIVTEVKGNKFTVIEGNNNDHKGHPVSYRTVTVNQKYIRGFATPLFDVENGITFEVASGVMSVENVESEPTDESEIQYEQETEEE